MKTLLLWRWVGTLGFLAGTTLLVPAVLQKSALTAPATTPAMRFDFGTATTQPGTVSISESTLFTPQLGYGWLSNTDVATRDRGKPDDLRGDFVMGKGAATFRIAGLAPGRYQLKIVCGDTMYGDHAVRIRVAGGGAVGGDSPLLAPQTAEFQTLTLTAQTTGTVDITFDSPQNNWVVNALSLEKTTAEMKPTVDSTMALPKVENTWPKGVFDTDPTLPLLKGFRAASSAAKPTDFRATGLKRADYLSLITGEVDFWKTKQNADGAIIDPYKNEEVQYSTPAFAAAAAVLVVRNNRADLLEAASKAMDWGTRTLANRKAANGHEDFYGPMLAHAFMLLQPKVSPARAARWEADLRRIDPNKTYRQAMGSMNWNIVSSSGEALFQKLGLRPNSNAYVGDSLAAQGKHFESPFGLYLEGPMAYDHFPRIFLADIIAQGYQGPYRAEVDEAMRRAAITSLFMQSPYGELPSGGRSAQHQWNEAEQCVTYEIYAARAQQSGDALMAGAYKRAAHLSLSSMQKWVRPSGEMQIVKNWVDPAKRHGYEGYSAHSQYNLLPMAMLAIASEYAAPTETVAERPAPADLGGFALQIPELHKVFANAGGTYVELDTDADSHYDATGLIRVQMKSISPQLGPSDSLVAHSSYQSPDPIPMTTGVGAAWQDAMGKWHTLGEMSGENIKNVAVKIFGQTPARVAFDVTYQGDFGGATSLIEHYILTPGRVELTTELPGYNGALRYQWPVLADDGRVKSAIRVENQKVLVSQDGGLTTQTFAPQNAGNVRVEEPLYSNHNGWARLGIADYPRGGKITLVIAAAR